MKREFRHKGKEDCEPLHYDWCGLDDIYLLSGYERIKTEDGDDIIIHNLDALHQAIGFNLASKKKSLNGKELRFLRHDMDLTQSELGDLMSVSAQSVARWEKQEIEIPGPAEMLLRVMYLAYVSKQVDPRELAKELRASDSKVVERQVFRGTRDGNWKAIAA